ncbi:GNAT family N-acetyltransferase [Thalassospira alkalitolerans]|uniref:Acetyltransferase n=1 Tax=Thalassospira alkalitolerans TaxID=1293890 RepID=A0A1Y2LEC8_9PROT|nr:GNAT family N-acetyltransferase [Thalassospira alkalitolerans]OSQ48862.1 acetyltransferase [Thalassospira alkalitolerans]
MGTAIVITIRPFRSDDIAAMRDIYARAVTEIGSRIYNPDQVRVWTALIPGTDRFATMMNDGRICLIATDENDCPLAFCDLEPDGHIHFLYAIPEISGTGAVAELYDAIENTAQERNIAKLYSEASELAKRFLVKQGFKVVERRDFEVAGIAIHNYAVEKRLRPIT